MGQGQLVATANKSQVGVSVDLPVFNNKISSVKVFVVLTSGGGGRITIESMTNNAK
jgi:hypothetical protein